MSYSAAFMSIAPVVASLFPKSVFLQKALATAGLAGLGADYMFMKRAGRLKKLEHEQNIFLKQAEMYRREAEKAVSPSPPSTTSKYLMEENSIQDVDCFSCATAHLAGMEGALRRASKEADKEGTCGPGCQRWTHLASQEPAALLLGDWTPAKYEKLPHDQQAVMDKYVPMVERQMSRIAPTPQGESVLKAAALLKESIRFAEAGDDIRHPEVEWRRLRAEAELAAAERIHPGALPPDTAQQLRKLRQMVGSGIIDANTLTEAAHKADALSLDINAPAWETMSAQELADIAEDMHSIRADFAADRAAGSQSHISGISHRPIPEGALPQELAMIAPGATGANTHHRIDEDVIADYTKPGVRAIAGLPEQQTSVVFDNVVERLGERGTKTLFRNLPTTMEYSIEGLFDPSTDNIAMGAAAMSKDNYATQSLLHEGTHSLLHNKRCRPVISKTAYEDMPEEKEAQAVSLATMLNLGLPVELWNGTELKPFDRQIDWVKLREKAGPQAEENVRWASEWLTKAARGEYGDLKAEKCPALRKVG